MDHRVAITGVTISIDGRTIEAVLEEKEKAKDKYDDAIASGNGAYLLENKEMFQMNVGRLLPHKSCQVILKFVCEMEILTAHDYQLIIPTAIFPQPLEAIHNISPIKTRSDLYYLNLCINGKMINSICNARTNCNLNSSWKEKDWMIIGEIEPTKNIVIDIKTEKSTKQSEFNVIIEKVGRARKYYRRRDRGLVFVYI